MHIYSSKLHFNIDICCQLTLLNILFFFFTFVFSLTESELDPAYDRDSSLHFVRFVLLWFICLF